MVLFALYQFHVALMECDSTAQQQYSHGTNSGKEILIKNINQKKKKLI